MNAEQLQKQLSRMNACSEAVKWSRGKSIAEAWETCERGDWLLWLAGRAEVDRRLLVLAACWCARTVLRFVPAGEKRPLQAIETAERWAIGEATLDEVRAAADAADAAYAAASAAYAAAYAAYAAAASAAYAADAAYAASAAYAAAVYADVVRAWITVDEVEQGLRRQG